MARSRSPDSIEAEKLYHRGMSLVDIAKKLGKPEGTVRRWKSTQVWGDKSEHSEIKANARNDNRTNEKEAIALEVKQVIDNPDLTDKQRLFCLLYVKYRNKVEAYQEAYGCSYRVACSNASTLWKKSEIQKEVNRLLEEYRSNIDLDIRDLFQWHLDIARADMTKFAEFGTNEIEDPETGNKIKYSYVNLKDSTEVNGMVISEVSKGRDGAKIKLNDRSKSMEWLDAHIGLADERQRAEIEQIKANTERIKKDATPEACEGVVIVDDIPESDNSEAN